MAISRTKTWIAGDVLLASDLNAEYNNILNNAADLVSPFTKAISMGGFALNFDAAKTMSLTSGTAGLNLSSTTAINDVYTTVASSATPDIWTAIGGVITYTGVATATGFAAAPQAGARRMLVCAGAAVFTAGANVLIAGVASGSNYTAAANDVILVTAVTTTQFLLDPIKYDGTSMRSSIQWAVAGGTVDAITATYAPPTGTLIDGTILGFRATGANATTTPSFSPNGGAAQNITRAGGGGLIAGDIPANLAECLIRYNLASSRWELLNPANPASGVTITNPANTTQALTDGVTISWNASIGAIGTVTIAGNRTMAAPTNLKTGGRYVLHVTQDATGGRTLAFNAVFKNQGGAATLPVPSPSLSTLTSYVFDSPDGTNLQLVNFYKQPTRQVFTTGTAATYTTPIGATRINVRLVGGGSGGSAATVNNGTAGNNTTFSTLTGSGGGSSSPAGNGGLGGAATGGDFNIPGGAGQGGQQASGLVETINGGQGGASAFGGNGAGGGQAAAGGNGQTNSGGGGGGGGGGSGSSTGGGGGAGGYCEKLFISPAATYTYTVGATATGGTAGTNAGGNGAAGIIIVDEYFN